MKQVESFIYLGTQIHQDGRYIPEIERRIAMAKNAYGQMSVLFKSRSIYQSTDNLWTKQRLLNTYMCIYPTLTYASECWTISEVARKTIEAAEMWFYRLILRISYTDNITNEEVLKRMDTEKILMRRIRKQQMVFLRHALRNKEIENLMVTEKLEGKRGVGGPRLPGA